MSYEAVERSEPALLVGLFAAVLGFLTLDAAGFSTLHSAAVAAGGAGSQALLTRPYVYSPKSISKLQGDSGFAAMLPGLFQTGPGFRHPGEPAAAIGLGTVLAGFLVQTFAGVDMTAALASSAGIAGLQTVATRSRVYSPVSARGVAAARLLAESPPDAASDPAPTPA